MDKANLKSKSEVECAVFTVKETAQFLGVNPIKCYELCRTPGFPVVRIGQKRLVVPKEALKRWLDAQVGK